MYSTRPRFLPAVAILVAFGIAPSASADSDHGADDSAPVPGKQSRDEGWSFYVDNDFLSAGLSDDQGYTGGFALSLAGERAADYPWSLGPVLGWVNRASGWSSLSEGRPRGAKRSWEIGTIAFTPDDTNTRSAVRDERPFAGLVFIGNTRHVYLKEQRIGYSSTLNLGVLGSPIPETIQDGLHELADDRMPRGWNNQISDGGEPTFLWQVQRRRTHWSRRSGPQAFDAEFSSVVGASVGYITQFSAGLTARWGEFSTPWWSFNPDFGEYINLGAPGARPGATELYLWTGAHLQQRFYDAFLEGQFRDSAVTFDRPGELDSSLWELNVGVTWGLPSGYHATLALRARDNELRDGNGQRPAWGSLIVGRSF